MVNRTAVRDGPVESRRATHRPRNEMNPAATPGPAVPSRRTHELRTGWPILVAATLGAALGFPTLAVQTLGTFAPELHQAFGWSYSQVMLGLAVVTAVMLITGPVAGWLCDRFDVRRVAVTSSLLLSCAFMGFAAANGSLDRYYGTWFLLALLGAGSAQVSWTRAINQHFKVHRGLALGIALSGVGLFALVGRVLASALVAAAGWRSAYIIIGLLPALLLAPVAAWGLRQCTPGAVARVPASGDSDTTGLNFAQALRCRQFWTLGVAFLPMSLALGGPIPNAENILLSHHFTRTAVASLVPWLGVTLIIGRVCGGWLADLIWVPLLASVLLSLTTVACLILAKAVLSYPMALVAILLLGAAVGAEIDLASYMVARYFGMKHYGLLYGTLYGPIACGAGLGPVIFARIFDRTGSYAPALVGAALGLALSGALFLSMGPYPGLQARPAAR